MTEQSTSPIGTVAQEAARLIEEMATMARSSYSRGGDPSRYARTAAHQDAWPGFPDEAAPKQEGRQRDSAVQDRDAPNRDAPNRDAPNSDAQGREGQGRQPEGSGAGEQTAGACSHCGAERGDTARDGVSSDCTFCPLCRGIGLLRSVRPETVDLLADLAMSVAASLREVALRSRASDAASSAASTSAAPADPDRPPVQDIPVDDESEG
jgi:hypothetical protein